MTTPLTDPELTVHPLAERFPEIPAKEFEELVQSIKELGLLEPIIINQAHQILDGRHRYRACQQLGVKVPTAQLEDVLGVKFGSVTEAQFIFDANYHRRHLTDDQRIALSTVFLPELRQKAQENIKLGYSKRTSEHSKSIPCHNDKGCETMGADGVRSELAKIANTGPGKALRAIKLADNAPDLLAQVSRGEKKLGDAFNELKASKPADAKIPPVQKRDIPKRHPKADEILACRDSGLTARETAIKLGRDETIVNRVIREEKIRSGLEVEITPEMLSLTDRQKLDLAIQQHKEKLDREFFNKVNARVQEFLEQTLGPILQKEQDEAKRIMEARKGVMDRKAYRKILSCLHPDRVSDAEQKKLYEQAFLIFTVLEKRLLDEKNSPTTFVNIPKTSSEWDELKRQAANVRKTKSKSKAIERRP